MNHVLSDASWILEKAKETDQIPNIHWIESKEIKKNLLSCFIDQW